MKEKIFRNFSLKILSALCAIVLWTIIVNIYDPTMGVTISTVPVQLINTESLTDKGYTYEITDGSKISVYVSGPKSVITDIKAADIVATADLSRITAFADYADIDVKVVKDGKTLTNVEVTPKTTAVKLDIENRVTQQFDVGMEVNGTEAEGYVVTKQSVSPSTIKITGSSTTIAKIAQVKAICDISNAQDNIQSVVPIVLYDADGNVIDDPQLELSKSEVEYTASVKKSKTVPLKYSVSGEPADGYTVHKVQSSADQITISGETKVLDTFTRQGYVLDKNRLINGQIFDEDYFDHLIAEIQEIRASERRFYQKITDIYATAVDYDKNSALTKEFYATVQNKMHYAVHGNTAAELIVARADHKKEHMGLTSWKNAPDGKIVKTDVSIAKNYLIKEELTELNEIVTMYLDYATRQARRHIPMTMEDWKTKLDAFLRFNDAEVLQDKGKVTATIAKEFAESEFEKYRVIQDTLYQSDFDRLVQGLENKEE